MHYYKRNLGDYAKKAGRLTMLQHGAYTLLIDACYDRERFPTLEEAIDWAWASTEAEIEAVKFVLSRFFRVENGVYIQDRIQEEIADYQSKAEKNRQIATNREANRTKRTRTVDDASPKEHEPSPNQEPLTKNQEPRTINQEPEDQKLSSLRSDSESPQADDSPAGVIEPIVSQVIAIYHEILPGCLKVGVINPKRRKRILVADKLAKSVCRSQEWEYDPAKFWSAYFRHCAADPWMRGDVPNPNNPKWRQNIDVLLAEDRFAGVMDRAIESMQGST